jgi:hypothetical protein
VNLLDPQRERGIDREGLSFEGSVRLFAQDGAQNGGEGLDDVSELAKGRLRRQNHGSIDRRRNFRQVIPSSCVEKLLKKGLKGFIDEGRGQSEAFRAGTDRI